MIKGFYDIYQLLIIWISWNFLCQAFCEGGITIVEHGSRNLLLQCVYMVSAFWISTNINLVMPNPVMLHCKYTTSHQCIWVRREVHLLVWYGLYFMSTPVVPWLPQHKATIAFLQWRGLKQNLCKEVNHSVNKQTLFFTYLFWFLEDNDNGYLAFHLNSLCLLRAQKSYLGKECKFMKKDLNDSGNPLLWFKNNQKHYVNIIHQLGI